MEAKFIRNRITELRIKKGVSEFQMSRDLGHSRSYIQQIVAGRTLPSLQEFLYICDSFGVTPSAFFDEKENEPILVQEITKMLRNLKDDDLLMLRVSALGDAREGGDQHDHGDQNGNQTNLLHVYTS